MWTFPRLARAVVVLAAGSIATWGAACGGDSSSTPATPPVTTPSNPTGPVVTLSPITVAFTSAAGDAQSVTLTNTGVAALQITSITVFGNFDQTNDCGATVEVGVSCTIRVTFFPRSATGSGVSGGNVTITDNAPTSPQTVTLTGPTVTSATARLSPASVSFGNQRIGTASAAQTVTLSNVPNGSATVALAISGVQTSGDFSVAQNACGSSLVAGGSCAISVTFNPTASGARSGTLIVFHNGPLGLVVIPLDGVGQ